MASELIDSIFDVSKISGEVASITANLDGLKTVISTYSIEVKKLYDSARGAKSQEDLSKASKEINDAMINGSKVTKEYQTELDKLKAKTDQLTGVEKVANIEIAKARLELAGAQKEIKATAAAEIEAAAATNKAKDSYEALQKEVKASIAAYRQLSAEETKSAQGQEMLKKINEMQTALKESDESMKIYNRNVGNYEGATKSLKLELREITAQLAAMQLAGQKNSEEYKILRQRGAN